MNYHILEFPIIYRTFCCDIISCANCFCAVSRIFIPACPSMVDDDEVLMHAGRLRPKAGTVKPTLYSPFSGLILSVVLERTAR